MRVISEKYGLQYYVGSACTHHPFAPFCPRETHTGECAVSHKLRVATFDRDFAGRKKRLRQERARRKRERKESYRLRIAKKMETQNSFVWKMKQRLKRVREIKKAEID